MGVLVASCGTRQDELPPPVATLGNSAAAERDVRPLIRRWMLATPATREALDAELASLATLHEGDPLARAVAVLMAWNALERGERERAVSLAQPVLDGPSGSVSDLARLVVGASERRSGRPKDALARLMPLLHKMIDPPATSLLDEELLRAAVAAADWRAAIHLMDVWLFESVPADRGRVLTTIKSLFVQVPAARLVDDLRARTRRGLDGSVDERRIAESIAQHLASVAVSAQDVRLARFLLAEAGPLLGATGEDVARLSGDRTRGRVAARTVGVLLALGSPVLARRSADVVTGMAFGMRIGDSDAQLVSRDDGGDPGRVPRALAELAAEGAAVIVAGLDPRHGPSVAAFAREEGLPVVLLTPTAAASSPDLFTLGEPNAGAVALLAEGLRDAGAKVVAALGAPRADPTSAEETSPGVGVELPCTPLPTAEALRTERVDAFVALDGAYCGNDALSLVRAMSAPFGVGLGAMVGVRLPDGASVAVAGIFPIPLDRDAVDPRLVGWFESGRPSPNWWMALGRDAAVLATEAVRGLSDASSEEDVRARRAEARAALVAADEPLWTSSATRFDEARRMPRAVTIAKWKGRGVVR
ncbi:MAG: hypothetical protein FJ096_16845 [Deltaproteobacteria bacterium]|nr:hypothetical protein [Deltaproteobacteria bacterium]